ncbi:MAG: hypothetical protein IT366_11640 [Candidatus Hydrogenedentes bacterium]|nr:hypothetical protein [Candidatus Hydrogenedentota bacterium]
MANIPIPVKLSTVTVRSVVPVPVTVTEPVTPSSLLNVMSCSASDTALAFVYVTVNDTGPVLVRMSDGSPMASVGAGFSTWTVVLGPAAVAMLPAASTAVPGAIDIPKVPFPVMFDIAIVRLFAPDSDTVMLPAAVPVVVSVTSLFRRVMESAPL